jgi:integrase
MIKPSTNALSRQHRRAAPAFRPLITRIRQDVLTRWSALRARQTTPTPRSERPGPQLEVRDLKMILSEAHRLGGRYAAIDGALFETAATSRRLRVGELLALRWGDIDWSASTVRVERILVERRVQPPKCGSARIVRLAPHTRRSLSRYRCLTGNQCGAEDLVFPDPRSGSFLDARRLRDRLHASLERPGLPRLAVAQLSLAFKAPWWSRYL